MAKIGSGKSVGWVAVILLFGRLLTVNAEPAGFLSIDCGSKTNYSDEDNIAWVTDANYIDVGQTESTNLSSYLQTLRLFPKPLNKSCYQLPVVQEVPYLLRLSFAVGNYSGFGQFPIGFAFSIETPGLLDMTNVQVTDPTQSRQAESIIVSAGNMLYICLIRTFQIDDPFINSIELRTLWHGMYPQAKPGRMLKSESRYDIGGNLSIRYPQDIFDRIWYPGTNLPVSPNGGLLRTVTMQEPISTNNTEDHPPTIVMQTAWVIESAMTLYVKGGNNSLLLLYFAEIEPLPISETRSFDVYILDRPALPQAITIMRNYPASELQIPLDATENAFTLVPTLNSSHGAILNAFEQYVIVDTAQTTYMKDVQVLESIKTRFDIKGWISDPCYVICWDGIVCDKSSSDIRVSEINLSGMNLTGPIPQNIGQLTGLVKVSLVNNYLTGPLPNLSNLSMLETLHLQNNSLNGTVPDWLAGLKNLTELFIDNNNFSGAIPAQLLKPSLKIRYTGNRYLYLPDNRHMKDTLRLILGITISGSIAVLVLVLVVGVVVHLKKSKIKENMRVEKESKYAVQEDNSLIILPNTTKSRFTLEEIMTATQNFSQKIGQGGFGSVFFGKLEQGTDVAVKVLSLFSKQGVQEFLNEVDLLSRVHHKNLVSLLGYCNESRELMLVYEHMSGGSLRDHLYGPSAELSQLNWKTRLKIASNAAQGLEYLHVGCTPKIIHRDIKTANILLDRNFNGKLADFGLSRVTIDGEDSHVTTTVKGTLGYLDPEYFSTQMLTEKSDVYSFGVVLLEIICGRRPIDVKLSAEQQNLIRWVTPYVEMDENPNKLAEIIDKRLGLNYDIKSITTVAKLAIRCVQPEPSSRPYVSEVVSELKEAMKLEEDKASLISEIDIEYGDLSVDSSEPKEMESSESSSSKLTTVPRVGL